MKNIIKSIVVASATLTSAFSMSGTLFTADDIEMLGYDLYEDSSGLRSAVIAVDYPVEMCMDFYVDEQEGVAGRDKYENIMTIVKYADDNKRTLSLTFSDNCDVQSAYIKAVK